MTSDERLLIAAWKTLQEADFQILQGLSDLKDEDRDFEPSDSITKAIALTTQTANQLTKAKTLIKP